MTPEPAVTPTSEPPTAAPVPDDLPASSPRTVGPLSGQAGGGTDGPDASPVAAAAPPRSRYSMGTLPNILRSMFVIGLFVLALVAVIPRISQVERPAVDAAGKASQTASVTKWPIEMPTGLGKGWVPTVATYAPGTDKVPTFTTVWTTPSGADIAFKQAVGATEPWLVRSVNDGALAGSATVAGRTFDRYNDSSRQQLSYVVRGEGKTGLTLAATSTGPEDELKTFVAALQRVTPSS